MPRLCSYFLSRIVELGTAQMPKMQITVDGAVLVQLLPLWWATRKLQVGLLPDSPSSDNDRGLTQLILR